MIRAVVFDFDGVIANSEPLHLRALQRVLAPLGYSVGRDEYYARYLGYDDMGAFRAIGNDRGVDFSDADIRGLIAAKSTSTSPTFRTATTARPTSVRIRRRKTV